MSTTHVTAKKASDAAITLGRRSWQQLRETLTEEELKNRQSAAGSLGGRPRKVSK